MSPNTPGLRVERALQFLPSADPMSMLRELVMLSSAPDSRERWSSSAAYLTVGKRVVDVDRLRSHIDKALPVVTKHLAAVYDAYMRAVVAAEAEDMEACVRALAEGGDSALEARRPFAAHLWYETAFRAAGDLASRDLEIEMLDKIGRLSLALGKYDDAARYYQRALVLAQSGFATESAIRAALGLGEATLALDELAGANAWFQQGIRLAGEGDYAKWRGRLEHQLGVVMWRQGHVAQARELLARSRDTLEAVGAAGEVSAACCALGRLEHGAGNDDAAMRLFQEAVAWASRGPLDVPALVSSLVRQAEVLASSQRWLDADSALRRAESLAIEHHLPERLVDVYIGFGALCTMKNDETGFVFFEQALELSRMPGVPPTTEARAFEMYAAFRSQFGERAEAAAYLSRAQSIVAAAGNRAALERLRSKVESLTA